jgi:hypothetical protein
MRNLDQRGDKNPYWKGGASSVLHSCSLCGKEFYAAAFCVSLRHLDAFESNLVGACQEAPAVFLASRDERTTGRIGGEWSLI